MTWICTRIATFRTKDVSGAVDAVPTSVVRGPDGADYVSELTGSPFSDGAAQIYRVVPGETPQVFQDGLKAVIDIAFGPDRKLYVLEHATGTTGLAGPGRVLCIAPDGTQEVVLEDLSRPTSVLVDRDGVIYVSNHGIEAGTGEVLRFQP